MIYIYRSRASTGARLLAEALGGRRIRSAPTRPQPGDVVVCWGEAYSAPEGVEVINGGPISNKLTDAQKLAEKGVPTIQVSLTQPVQEVLTDPAVARHQTVMESLDGFMEAPLNRSGPYRDGLGQIYMAFADLIGALSSPAPVAQDMNLFDWLPRLRNHVGGNDLLSPPASPDFWAKKEEFIHEYRVHSFDGQSIRAGVKRPREGFENPHPWIRSWDAGHRISYDGVTVRQGHRDLAHQAVNALGLTFGAVDIGETADGRLLVLEVNRAPGLEGGTITAYANAIRRWSEE